MPDNRYSCVVDRDRHKRGGKGRERSYLHVRRRGSSGLSALIIVRRRITTRVERRTSEASERERERRLSRYTHIRRISTQSLSSFLFFFCVCAAVVNDFFLSFCAFVFLAQCARACAFCICSTRIELQISSSIQLSATRCHSKKIFHEGATRPTTRTNQPSHPEQPVFNVDRDPNRVS